MRSLLNGGLILLSLTGAAGAQSYDRLRGSDRADSTSYEAPYRAESPVFYRWSGFYVGGQIGRSASRANFGNGVDSLVGYILRNDVVLDHVDDWTTLPKKTSISNPYGGFIGYSTQWEELVVGFELNYNRTSSRIEAADGLSRAFQDDTGAPAGHHYFYSASVNGSASANLTDFGTIRARAGASFGQFLPYAFAALAVGRVDVTRSATVSYRRTDIPDAGTAPQPTFTMGPVTKAESQKGVFAYGYGAGVGVDIALLPNVFLRGEWEYIQFTPVKDINININSVRTGLAVRF